MAKKIFWRQSTIKEQSYVNGDKFSIDACVSDQMFGKTPRMNRGDAINFCKILERNWQDNALRFKEVLDTTI